MSIQSLFNHFCVRFQTCLVKISAEMASRYRRASVIWCTASSLLRSGWMRGTEYTWPSTHCLWAILDTATGTWTSASWRTQAAARQQGSTETRSLQFQNASLAFGGLRTKSVINMIISSQAACAAHLTLTWRSRDRKQCTQFEATCKYFVRINCFVVSVDFKRRTVTNQSGVNSSKKIQHSS